MVRRSTGYYSILCVWYTRVSGTTVYSVCKVHRSTGYYCLLCVYGTQEYRVALEQCYQRFLLRWFSGAEEDLSGYCDGPELKRLYFPAGFSSPHSDLVVCDLVVCYLLVFGLVVGDLVV